MPMNLPVTLPADLPEDWTPGQTVAPSGTSVGLTKQHGYNYLMEQVNNVQTGVNFVAQNTPDAYRCTVRTATLSSSSWRFLAGTGYLQTVFLSGAGVSVQPSNPSIVDVDLSDLSQSETVETLNSWYNVTNVTDAAGQLRFICAAQQPTVDIPIIVATFGALSSAG